MPFALRRVQSRDRRPGNHMLRLQPSGTASCGFQPSGIARCGFQRSCLRILRVAANCPHAVLPGFLSDTSLPRRQGLFQTIHPVHHAFCDQRVC